MIEGRRQKVEWQKVEWQKVEWQKVEWQKVERQKVEKYQTPNNRTPNRTKRRKWPEFLHYKKFKQYYFIFGNYPAAASYYDITVRLG